MSKFIKSLPLLPLEKRQAMWSKARVAYDNKGPTTMTDAEFDALEDSIRAEAPKWSKLKKTGSKVGKKSKVKLDVPMPSLDKIQAGTAGRLTAFLKSVNWDVVVSEKLDGSSVQSAYAYGTLARLSTRGDGVIGKDISYFIPYVNLPAEVPAWKKIPLVVLRHEAVVPIKLYEKKWATAFDSARAMASSLLNRQDVHPALDDLQFVVLRVLHPSMCITAGFLQASKAAFELPRFLTRKHSVLTENSLVTQLDKWRATAKYDTDGLVLFSNAEDLETTGDRPKYAKAFKVNDEENAPLTTIIRIQWQPSRHGTLVPKAIIKPIQFGNVTVKQAALHNAKWAIERGCGEGAVVRVLRSGDIIPKIVSVETPVKFALPKKADFGPYQWDATGTSLVLEDKNDSAEVRVREFSNFFAKLDLEQMSGGLAEKLVAAGVTKTWQLPRLDEEAFAGLAGVKKMAASYAKQMERVRNGEFTLAQLMVASGCFSKGAGSTRIETLFEAFPDQSKWEDISEDDVAAIKGCGPAFAKIYMEGLPKFALFMRRSGAVPSTPRKKAKAIKGKWTGVMGSWTGYRSKEEEAAFVANGGTVVPFGGKTSVLFYKDDGKASGKVDKAREKGLKVVSFSSFK